MPTIQRGARCRYLWECAPTFKARITPSILTPSILLVSSLGRSHASPVSRPVSRQPQDRDRIHEDFAGTDRALPAAAAPDGEERPRGKQPLGQSGFGGEEP